VKTTKKSANLASRDILERDMLEVVGVPLKV